MDKSGYSNLKIFRYMGRLAILKKGEQPNPVCIYLILSDICNLRCEFCPYIARACHNKNGFMDIAKAKQIINDCEKLEIKAIELTGGGESTLNPNFNQITSHIIANKLDIGLITNGTVLLKRCSLENILSMKWIRFSIDADSGKSYAKTKRTKPQNFSKVIKTIEKISSKRAASSVVLGTGFVVHMGNYLGLYNAVKIFKEAGADYIRITFDFSGGTINYWEQIKNNVTELIQRSKDDFADDNFQIFNKLPQKIQELKSGIVSDKICPIMHFRTYIAVNGNIYVCCAKAYKDIGLCGSIANSSLFEFWHSQAKKTFFKNFNPRKCGVCPYYTKNKIINDYLFRGAKAVPAPPSPHENFI